jgi:hypothetical protein
MDHSKGTHNAARRLRSHGRHGALTDRPNRVSQTPEPTVQDETANKSDNSAADGVQGDHADQQESEHHQGCAALPVAVSACDHNRGNAD